MIAAPTTDSTSTLSNSLHFRLLSNKRFRGFIELAGKIFMMVGSVEFASGGNPPTLVVGGAAARKE
jgi:hypothetical protein